MKREGELGPCDAKEQKEKINSGSHRRRDPDGSCAKAV